MEFKESSLVIFFSLTEAPLTDPTPTPPNTPETDPKRTRNRPETEPNGAERSQTEPNGAEMDRNEALLGGTDGGVCRDWGGGGGCKGKRIFGVAQTVFLVNRVFVPCQKRGHFDENGENDEFAFYPLKTRVWLLRPPKTTKTTKMGVSLRKSMV